MLVYDRAHELARALKGSDEYQSYLRAKERIKSDEPAKKMLADLRAKQWQVQAAQLAGKEAPPDLVSQVEKLYEIVSYHPGLKDLLQAEYRLGKMLADVQKIIAESVDLWEGEEPPEGHGGQS